jgi:glycosyltransferase involved in cell wall biosynthesis
MDKNCLVTIGIPARNAEKFIRFTLDNLLINDFDPNKFEILIGNNGSEDKTCQIVSEYQQKHSNIRMCDIPFEGSNRPRVRNVLAENAKGKILIYIDQDILVSRGFIRSHVEAHEKYGESIVTGYTYGKCSMDGVKGFTNTYADKLNLNNITESHPVLKGNDCFKDGRESLGYIECGELPYIDLKNTIAPFKSFWLCNVSIERDLLLNLGGFDEIFREWGLDDDDIAYKVELSQKNMIFSCKAWAYHMYHPVVMQNNISTWRKNSGYLFSKYQTRELEFFYVYKGRVDSAQIELTMDIDSMPSGAIVQQIAEVTTDTAAKRLGILITSEDDARALKLTECFNPSLPLNSSVYQKENCRYWSLLGIHTAFKSREIDETIIIADSAMFLDEALLKLLMLEISRISKKVIIYFGTYSRTEQNSFLLTMLKDIMEVIHFDSLECRNI